MEDYETLETLPNRHIEIAERVMNGQMSAAEAGKARGALDQKLERISKALAEAQAS